MALRGEALDQPLHLSVGRGDLVTVTALLNHDADPNHPAGNGDTPLHVAARLSRPDITQLLLLHGANPRATNAQGDTALHVAATHARRAHTQLLLNEGALPNAKNNLGMTPLWMVCQNGPWIEDEEAQQAQSAALLARSNALMVGGQYAEAEKLLLASDELAVDDEDRRDCCEVARMLVQRGAQVNCVDTALGDTPLTVAASQASVAYQAYLRANPPPEKPERQPWDREPEPQLHVLEDVQVAFGYRVRVQLNLILLLLKAGANHEHANAAGHTALTLTAELPSIQALLLGKPKADEDLLLAAATGSMATARAARDSGASLSKTTSHGTSTALHLAASFGRVKRDPQRPAESSSVMVKFLLDEGADVNVARNGDKLTPLCMAAQAGHSHIVQVLLQRGADRDQPNHRGLTPLWYAARNGHATVAQVLLQSTCTKDCGQTCTKRHVGCRVDRANSDGISPLWIAAASGHADAVRVLLLHHASIDRTDNSGATPLWIACKRGHEAVAQLLARGLGVVHHADLDSPTRLNQTQARANVDRPFEDGLTPRWVANKRYGWNTSGWEGMELEPAEMDLSETISKQRRNTALELGRRSRETHSSNDEPVVDAHGSETVRRPAARMKENRRGWTSHRDSASSRAHQQQDCPAVAKAFRAEGYAAMVNTLTNEDAVCLQDFYQRHQKNNS